MKTLILSLLCVLLMASCSKETLSPPPSDPDLGASVVQTRPIVKEAIPFVVEYSIFDICTNEYVDITGTALLKSSLSISSTAIKHSYNLTYTDAIGKGQLSGKLYKTTYKSSGVIIVDITNDGYIIQKNTEKAKIVYSCDDGSRFTCVLNIRYAVDRSGDIKVDETKFDFNDCS